jgi:hypothetical protein
MLQMGYISNSSKVAVEAQNMFYVSASFLHIFTLIDNYQLFLSAGAATNFVIAASMLYFVCTFSLKVYPLFLKPCTVYLNQKNDGVE